MRVIALVALVCLLAGCGVGSVPEETPGQGAGSGACGPIGDVLHATPTLHGGFDKDDTAFWLPEGACPSWGAGVELTTEQTLQANSVAEVTRAGCKLTSTLVHLPAPRSDAERRAFTVKANNFRTDDTCVMGSSSAAHCAELTIHWYDPNGRFMYDELFQVGGQRAGEWYMFSANGYASDYAQYFSVSVGGPMSGIDTGRTYIDSVTVEF